ncbi:MAG: hypothetical protein WAO98_08325 [Alphaproteobacteria bacterium]
MSDLVPPDQMQMVEPSAVTTGPTWQDQDGVLRDMWMQNQTPQAISEALGRSVPAIMTRAARLGLPRRSAPGRKPGRRLDENGAVISSSPRSVTRTAPRETQALAPQTSLRVCLMCLTKFESLGRHNRICSHCKGSAEYETASSLPELHIPVS